MENVMYCQSCGMPLDAESYGSEKDGGKSMDYCRYCYVNGAFTSDQTMEEMIETCVPHCSNNNPWPDADTARAEMRKFFPSLKRWAAAK
ncbi:MAG: zinc ribbon domain-containing protein [Clostridiales bacterium]|jgi:hypothetical protein|nr:zinc ribbon domain-containing protein [Clostridiales bacterium]